MIKNFIQAVIFLLFSANVAAHALHITAQYDGVAISGKAYYSDQTPAAETYVEAVKTGETEPAVYGKTDREGRFSLPFTQDGTFSVIIEGMEGHRAETTVQKMAASSPMSNTELQLLREEIAQLKDKIYWRDILGGIGYILGIFGIVALLKTRKGK
ncbi:carboxypeptidase regulatory-like domain-containing protein [Haemophilus parahaemolyticus]|uniref:hypothetical protein n=1 Tax=Haemophilus parahaemolyticus TaxID=735 RepID=UPI00058D5FF5|nr:hypothetical protein [Haemophilus parahaemolyticus]